MCFFGTGRRNRTTSTGLETGNQAPETCVLPLHYARMRYGFILCTGMRSRTTSVGLETDIQAPKTCVLPLHYARVYYGAGDGNRTRACALEVRRIKI